MNIVLSQVKDDSSNFLHDVCDSSDVVLAPNVPMPSFLVMRRGLSMQQWIQNGRPTPLMALWMLADVIMQVAKLHRLGYVHRDLKPGNILFIQVPYDLYTFKRSPNYIRILNDL